MDSESSAGVRRSLRLLKELKRGEKGCWDGTISYGIDDAYDKSMQSWTGTIISPPNTVYEGCICQLKLICGLEYHDKPPTVKFQTPINMSVVNKETGVVEPELFPMLGEWLKEFTMEDILYELKCEMMYPRNQRLAQPPNVLCRSFRLVKELKRGEKGIRDDSISYRIDDADDVYMQSWTGTIIGPCNTVYEGRIYQLKLLCSLDYPHTPPRVRFQTHINMTVVNQDTGMVEPELFPMFANWQRGFTMEDILRELKAEMMSMKNQRLAQPPKGKPKKHVTIENEEQADLPTYARNIAEEEVMKSSTKIPKEVARKGNEVDEFKTLDGPRKSVRHRREPTWLKDYCKGKSERKYKDN